jgi:hypothetical protein
MCAGRAPEADEAIRKIARWARPKLQLLEERDATDPRLKAADARVGWLVRRFGSVRSVKNRLGLRVLSDSTFVFEKSTQPV